jgi:hypothetical protein
MSKSFEQSLWHLSYAAIEAQRRLDELETAHEAAEVKRNGAALELAEGMQQAGVWMMLHDSWLIAKDDGLLRIRKLPSSSSVYLPDALEQQEAA